VVVSKTCMAIYDVATPKFLDNEDVESKMMMITLTQELMMTLRMIMMKKRRRQ
jgi:hypothetical protein